MDYIKQLKTLHKCRKQWQNELDTNTHGLQQYAKSAIKRLDVDIEMVMKLQKMRK